MMAGFSRRSFLYALGMLAAGSTASLPVNAFGLQRKLKVVLVGTGVRGISFWRRLVEQYPDQLQFVGLSDINPGRATYSPFEGWRIAFNGQKGRIEAWLDITFAKMFAGPYHELKTPFNDGM